VKKLVTLLTFIILIISSSICYAVEMKQYISEEHNFSIQIPKVCDYYIPTIPHMPPSLMYAASNTGYNIDVKVFPMQDKAEGDDNSLRGLGFMYRNRLKQSGNNILTEKLIILDSGKHAFLTSYTRPASFGGGTNIFGTAVYLWTRNKIYILNYSITSLDYEKYADSIRDSYQSFKTLT